MLWGQRFHCCYYWCHALVPLALACHGVQWLQMQRRAMEPPCLAIVSG